MSATQRQSRPETRTFATAEVTLRRVWVLGMHQTRMLEQQRAFELLYVL